MTRNAILTRDSSHLRFRKEIVGSISLLLGIQKTLLNPPSKMVGQ
jgi:hypothetical protein